MLENNIKNGNYNNKMKCNCNYTPEGINADFGYNTETKTNDNINNENSKCCGDKYKNKQEMLNKIKCLNFSVIELGLYLDTHVDDKKAICLHKEYCRQLRSVKDEYQKLYGPLSIYFPCNKWKWIEEPWPWEGGNN